MGELDRKEEKAERWRTDAFKLWCWRRFLRVPWMARRANQSILGNKPWIFIGRTNTRSWSFHTLATWCEELTHWKRPWCWERLRAWGKMGQGEDRGWDGWMASATWWIWVWTSSERWRTGKPAVLQSMGSQRVGHDLSTEQQDGIGYRGLCWTAQME